MGMFLVLSLFLRHCEGLFQLLPASYPCSRARGTLVPSDICQYSMSIRSQSVGVPGAFAVVSPRHMSFLLSVWSYSVVTLHVVAEQNVLRALTSTSPVAATIPMSCSCLSDTRRALKRGPV